MKLKKLVQIVLLCVPFSTPRDIYRFTFDSDRQWFLYSYWYAFSSDRVIKIYFMLVYF